MSLPRFLLVLFPIFMWLAVVCEERRTTDRVARGPRWCSACSPPSTRPGSGWRDAVRAVLLDALGTLVELQPPGAAAAADSARRDRVDVGSSAAERGFAAEIALLPGQSPAGRGRAGAGASLRDDCAEGMRARSVATSWTTRRARARCSTRSRSRLSGRRSGTDCASPPGAQARRRQQLGLLPAAVARTRRDCGSCSRGRPRPSSASPSRRPAVFEAGLRLAAGDVAEALFVGHHRRTTCSGARAAGLRAVLVQRAGETSLGCRDGALARRAVRQLATAA